MQSDPPPPARKRPPFPWWLSVVLAIGSYVLLKYLVPTFEPVSPWLRQLCLVAPSLAPLVAIALLLLAAKQLYDRAPASATDRDKGSKGAGPEAEDPQE